MQMPAHWQRLSTTLLLSLLLSAFTQADGCSANIDSDGDGYTSDVDCDDANASTYPGAPEQCNQLDDDCDGLADEGVLLSFYTDVDGDGYGNASASVEACAQPEGYVEDFTDCDDANPSAYPGAPEQCNQLDDDCDGAADEDMPLDRFYTDADGDGYGDASVSVEACAAPAGTVSNDRDCDDTNASVYPGAPDAVGDASDLSCDGSDGLAPSVGLPTSTFITLQAAMDAAAEGQTVWVGPGTYREYGLSMKGKALRLVSTEGEKATIIDAQGQGTVLYFNAGETEESVLEGFTLTGGYASCNTPVAATSCVVAGGGIFMDNASPTLTHVTFTGNTADAGDRDSYDGYGYGGGMYLSTSSPTLTHVTFTGNRAVSSASEFGYGYGGGMYLDSSSPTLTHVTFSENEAYVDFGRSYSRAFGGGMYLSTSSPTLTHVTFTGNRAEVDGYFGSASGGGMYLDSSSPTLTHVTFTGNTAYGSTGCLCGYMSGEGGGMYLSTSSPTLTHVTFTGNRAVATSSDYSNYNQGNYYGAGGGMYLYESSPTLTHSILAYNPASTSGGNLYRYTSESPPSTVTAQYALIYNPAGWKADNVTPSGSYLTVEPQFLDYADSITGASCTPGSSTTCLPADLHPALGSPLVNAGDPAQQDVDGSRADLGSYGGSGGDQWDVDGDGTPDYFWPGERSDAPSGFNPADYDLDDLDADVQ